MHEITTLTTSTSLHQEIISADLDDLFSRIIFSGTPFIFGEDAVLFRRWRARLASSLRVDASEVVIVGSAAVGHSLNPHKDLTPFNSNSDVDVAVISEHYFSEAWHHLRGIDTALSSLTPRQLNWLVEHRKRLIYWGCIATDKILPILPFAVEWMEAREQAARDGPLEGRDIKFRIYKDFRALRTYHLTGLKELRVKLLE